MRSQGPASRFLKSGKNSVEHEVHRHLFRTAEKRLTELWLAASDKAAVSAAADAIDILLQTDAQDLGEARTERNRYLEVAPLGVYFEVRLPDRLVIVRNVWRPPT